MDELGHRKYFNTREEVLRTAASMENRLEQKYARPDIFRKPARKDPATFDLLVKELTDEAVFHNEAHNLQKCLLIDKYSLHLYVLGPTALDLQSTILLNGQELDNGTR